MRVPTTTSSNQARVPSSLNQVALRGVVGPPRTGRKASRDVGGELGQGPALAAVRTKENSILRKQAEVGLEGYPEA